jgi:hypothetical protein
MCPRLKSNPALERAARQHLESFVSTDGEQTFELSYRAASWSEARRVVLVVPNHREEQKGLFPDHFFLVTNAPAAEVDGASLLARYRKRGEAELILKSAARVLLSAHRITVVIEASRARPWSRFTTEMDRLHSARGSPRNQALPTPV